jgi:hypothetical protein
VEQGGSEWTTKQGDKQASKVTSKQQWQTIKSIIAMSKQASKQHSPTVALPAFY